ncbi:MAG: hypothetical protein ACP5QA_01880 [Phycisphaerae bacterium]
MNKFVQYLIIASAALCGAELIMRGLFMRACYYRRSLPNTLSIMALMLGLVISSNALTATVAAMAITYHSAGGSTVVVRGHSTLHNWSVRSSTLTGKMILSGPTASGKSVAMDLLHVAIPVSTLKGSDGSGMTDTIMHALHRRQHPHITFILTHAKPQKAKPTKSGTYIFHAVGLLKINGIMRKESLKLLVTPHRGGNVTVQTRVKLKMRDFAVTPPTTMLGIIRSSNAVTISAKWQLTKAQDGRKPGSK